MKALTKKISEPKFEPIELKLNIVTQKEFDMIHCLFNYTPICEIMRGVSGINPHDVRIALERVGKVNTENSVNIMKQIGREF